MRGAERLGLGAREQIAFGVIVQQRHGRLQQRAVHPLAETGALAVQQRVDDAEGGEDAGGQVQEGHAAAQRRAVRLAGDGHDPAERLHERLVTRRVLARPRSTEGRDRAVDEPGIHRRQGVVAQPERLHRAGPEVLDENVGRRRHALEDLDALGRLEVERHVALVPVDHQERGRLAVLVRWPCARLVAGPGVFHLDDVGAQVGQEHAAERSGQHTGEIEDANAVEREGRGGRGHALLYLP
jgi:hypothetical protein